MEFNNTDSIRPEVDTQLEISDFYTDSISIYLKLVIVIVTVSTGTIHLNFVI